jgi:hypothetical protein
VETAEFLEHFGVKGMHWGVRRSRTATSSSPSSSDHAKAVSLSRKVVEAGGVHALSNEELSSLNTRLNLENNFHKLTSDTATVDKGRHFVKSATQDARSIINAVNTGRDFVRTVQGLHSDLSGAQRRRSRNAPLRVVSVR